MNILYGQQVHTEQRFTYDINQGGNLAIRLSNGSGRKATIVFVNRKFKSVEWDVEGEWENSRSAWHVRGAIAARIAEIEASFQAPQAPS